MEGEGEMVQVEQAPRECCRDSENHTEPERISDDLTVTYCSECGARHFVFIAELGESVTEGASL